MPSGTSISNYVVEEVRVWNVWRPLWRYPLFSRSQLVREIFIIHLCTILDLLIWLLIRLLVCSGIEHELPNLPGPGVLLKPDSIYLGGFSQELNTAHPLFVLHILASSIDTSTQLPQQPSLNQAVVAPSKSSRLPLLREQAQGNE
jgi:hypothetical protein